MWRLSLRELLVLVALVAFAIVSLKYASDVLRGIIGLIVLVAYLGSIIAAVMDRGPRRAFAIGMALAMTTYGALIIYVGRPSHGNQNHEFQMGSGHLPTSNLLHPLYMSIVEWEDVIENGTIVSRTGTPYPATFMMIGHYWWTLLLGYAGGRFAASVYSRRMKEQKPLAAQPS